MLMIIFIRVKKNNFATCRRILYLIRTRCLDLHWRDSLETQYT